MAAGVFMVILGINMLGIFPWLRRFQLQLPRFLVRNVNRKKAGSSQPFVIGLLNGMMPCGPLQSMQIVALASANPFAGALSMLAFSLGTVPLMLGLGSFVAMLGKRFSAKVMETGAVLVVVAGPCDAVPGRQSVRAFLQRNGMERGRAAGVCSLRRG